MKYLQKRSYILLFLAVILLSSCVPEKRLARNFVNNPPSNKFLINTPDFVLKESLKPLSDSLQEEDLSEREKDSLSFLKSEIVKNISDEMFYSLYLPEMNRELDSLGLNVTFNKPPEKFFTDTTSNAYIFDIAQLQLQEYSEEIYDYETFGAETYYKKHIRDGLLLNSWVEFQKVNSDNKPALLFAELSRTDRIEGYFKRNQLTGEVKYSYKRDDLGLSDAKEMIKKAGRKHARYIYDYLMNQYIKAMMKNDEMKPQYYLHYNRFDDSFESVVEDRFTRQK